MSGAIELYQAAKKRGITPIVGLEAYLVPDRHARPARERRAHITLLAENTTGYYNLIKLCSKGFLEGYHRKPRIDYELMSQHADGVIALTGCLSGTICGLVEHDDLPGARAELDRLVQIFGSDDLYVEIQDSGIPVQHKINVELAKLARDAGQTMVATCDAHYVCQHDADAHEALLAIQTRDVLSNPNRFRFDTKEFYLKTGAEMAAGAAGLPRRDPGLAGDRRALRGPGPPDRRGQAAAVPGARRLDADGVPGAALPRGHGAPLRRPAAGGRRGPAALRARRHRGDGLLLVFPDRLGLHPLGARERRRGRSGPWLGRRVAGGVHACGSRTWIRSSTGSCSSAS